MGKPVISTDLPEVKIFNKENDNLVLIGEKHEEFISYIYRAINDPNGILVKKRISAAEGNSWAKRIEAMCKLIDEIINMKERLAHDWKGGLRRLYKRTKRTFLGFAVMSLSLYFLIFYTPLVWFLASPLKISHLPVKADCIVVFAGGVGESGKAGQGYEERVKYAVELYNKGYAKNLIFSSGYVYVFKEPYVMKALAVALGVPQEAIILEDEASGTYQNVKFTSDILLSKGWNEILLVSSPYNIRRASLVFKKLDKNLKVVYTPVINPQFYHRKKRVKLEQIKAIAHEYLGIIYYWWKGYI